MVGLVRLLLFLLAATSRLRARRAHALPHVAPSAWNVPSRYKSRVPTARGGEYSRLASRVHPPPRQFVNENLAKTPGVTSWSRTARALGAAGDDPKLLRLLAADSGLAVSNVPGAWSRRALILAASIATPSAVGAIDGGGVTRNAGDEYVVRWNGTVGSDISFGGGKGVYSLEVYNPRVVGLSKDSLFYKQGVRIGDELVSVGKTRKDGPVKYAVELRTRRNVDSDVKKLFIASKPGGNFMGLRARGLLQPGDRVPDFALPTTAKPEEEDASLKELLSSGKRSLVFFRPGAKSYNGDLLQLQAYNRAVDDLAAAGVQVVGVSTDPSALSKRLVNKLKLKYQLLTDDGGDLAGAFGARRTGVQGYPGGLVIDRRTFIVGPDGLVESTFAELPWEPDIDEFSVHLASIAQAVGADAEKVRIKVLDPPKKLGEFLDAARQPPAEPTTSASEQAPTSAPDAGSPLDSAAKTWSTLIGQSRMFTKTE